MRTLRTLLMIAAISLAAIACDKNPLDKPEKAAVGTDGGTFRLGDITIEVPAGALDKPTDITAKKIDGTGTETAPIGMLAAYEFGPDGTAFNSPAKVTVTLPELVPGASQLAVFTYVEKFQVLENGPQKAWEMIGFADVNGLQATFEVNHFSKYAVSKVSVEEMVSLIKLVMSTSPKDNQTSLMNALNNRLVSVDQMNLLNRWDVDWGLAKGTGIEVFYAPTHMSASVMNAENDFTSNLAYDSQILLDYGKSDWENGPTHTGSHECTSISVNYKGSEYQIIETQGKTWEELKKDYQCVISIMLDRALDPVNPTMELKELGALKKKHDKEEVQAKMYVQHTDEVVDWRAAYSAARIQNGQKIFDYGTRAGDYEHVFVRDYEEGKMDRYDCSGYVIDFNTEFSKLELHKVEGEKHSALTDKNGEAVIEIEALEDDIHTFLEGKWEYDYSLGEYSYHAGAYASIPIKSSEDDWQINVVVDAVYDAGIEEGELTPMSFQYTIDGTFREPVMTYINGDGEIVPEEEFDPDDEDSGASMIGFGSATVTMTQELTGNTSWHHVSEENTVDGPRYAHTYMDIVNLRTLWNPRSQTIGITVMKLISDQVNKITFMLGDLIEDGMMKSYPMIEWGVHMRSIDWQEKESERDFPNQKINSFAYLILNFEEGTQNCPYVDIFNGDTPDPITETYLLDTNFSIMPLRPAIGQYKATVTLKKLSKDDEE